MKDDDLIAGILDDCAGLLLADGEPTKVAYMAGYVSGRLESTAVALRDGDTRMLAAIATALSRKVAEVQAQA